MDSVIVKIALALALFGILMFVTEKFVVTMKGYRIAGAIYTSVLVVIMVTAVTYLERWPPFVSLFSAVFVAALYSFSKARILELRNAGE
jgi:hypothetical protein